MTPRETADAADRMIEAAQCLERCAKDLKAGAKILRQHGLPGAIEPKLWNMHKKHDVRGAAARAIDVLGEEY
jgi:hypothetical protein